MRSLYFQVQNGCAGDMLVASLLDVGLSLADLKRELERIPLSGYHLKVSRVKRPTDFGHHIEATVFRVVPKSSWKDKTSYREIVQTIEKSSLLQSQKDRLKKILGILARAEADIHGEKVSELHFHQIGQVDALVEMSAVVIGIDLLQVEEVSCSSIGVAEPSPATAEVLKGMPTVVHGVPYEITTPTGAAILRGLCPLAGKPVTMNLEATGYGAGQRAEPAPNVVQVLLGGRVAESPVAVLETNIDDMNPVFFEVLMERLFKAGALDVSLFPGQGKKSRPVFQLQVISRPQHLERICEIIFAESTTLGVRFRLENRLVLERRMEKISTAWGEIPVKFSFWRGQVVNFAPEYEACKKVAGEFGLPLKEVYTEVIAWCKQDLKKKKFILP